MKLEMKYRAAVRAGLRQTQQGKKGSRGQFMTLVCTDCWEVGPCLQTRRPRALRRLGRAEGWLSKRVIKTTYGYRTYKMHVKCPECQRV